MLEIERRSVLELEFETKREYKNPFLDSARRKKQLVKSKLEKLVKMILNS